MNIEIERKYLILLPDLAFLRTVEGCRVWEILQTYLYPRSDEPETERRVRTLTENGEISYVYTRKSPKGYLSRYEDERNVSREEYKILRRDASVELFKTRYAFPFAGHVMEIDVYPPEFGGELLAGYAILEVEMNAPDEAVDFPDFLEILREVTEDRRYSNKTLAKKV